MYEELEYIQRFELNSSSGIKAMLLCVLYALYVVSMNKTVNNLTNTTMYEELEYMQRFELNSSSGIKFNSFIYTFPGFPPEGVPTEGVTPGCE